MLGLVGEWEAHGGHSPDREHSGEMTGICCYRVAAWDLCWVRVRVDELLKLSLDRQLRPYLVGFLLISGTQISHAFVGSKVRTIEMGP